MVKVIRLSGGEEAMVDDEDYPMLSRFAWYSMPSYSPAVNIYGPRTGKNITLRMHQLITGGTFSIEAKDGNYLNMQKSNIVALGLSTGGHKHPKKGYKKDQPPTSEYKGVSWADSRREWVMCIQKKGKRISKYFKNEKDAARAYNTVAKVFYGEDAVLNVVNDKTKHSEKAHERDVSNEMEVYAASRISDPMTLQRTKGTETKEGKCPES